MKFLNTRRNFPGPLLDRIDIQIDVPRIKIEELRKGNKDAVLNKKIRDSVIKAREIQKERFSKIKHKINLNSEMSSKLVDEMINLSDDAEILLKIF